MPDKIRTRALAATRRFCLPLLAALISLPTAAAGADEFMPGPVRHPVAFISGGMDAGLGEKLLWQPQVGAYLDVPWDLQLGLQIRSDLAADERYDWLPQIGLQLRKLWLGDEDKLSVENSEYFCATVGGYFAYDFGGVHSGLRPFGSVTGGKYWMPFAGMPAGLDLYLGYTRYFMGHLPGKSSVDFISGGINVFRVLRLP